MDSSLPDGWHAISISEANVLNNMLGFGDGLYDEGQLAAYSDRYYSYNGEIIAAIGRHGLLDWNSINGTRPEYLRPAVGELAAALGVEVME